MPNLIASPTPIASVGNLTKVADEYVGLTNNGDPKVSISHVRSPAGWEGVWQYSDYHEYRVVLKGLVRVDFSDGTMDVQAGQALDVHPREWVRYSTPDEAEYISVCLPAFSRASVHRDK
jgi:quercetin dioxygenase-like cupin family protein